MSDKKITQLNNLPTSDNNDVIAIVDVSANETKRQTKQNFLKEVMASFDNFYDKVASDARYLQKTQTDLLYYPLSSNPAGYLTGESDPVFVASPAYGITSQKITNWDNAYSWGNHAGLYDLIGSASSAIQAHNNAYNHSLIATAIQSSEKGSNNGVATLDVGGKIPANQLPSTVMEFKGTWNATTNIPALADGVGDAGDVYICSVAGTHNFGSGDIVFAQGDWVLYSGSIWEKSINSNAVVSVNGQQGVVSLNTSHISENMNLYFTAQRAVDAVASSNAYWRNDGVSVATGNWDIKSYSISSAHGIFGQISPYPVSAPTNGTATQTDGGVFTDDANEFAFRVYAYKNVIGGRVYSAPLVINFNDTGTSTLTYNILLNWSAVIGADGYRIIVDEDNLNNFYGDAYKDVATNSLEYDGTVDEAFITVNISSTIPINANPNISSQYDYLIDGSPIGVSHWNNDAGYITGYTETSTLDNVLQRGNSSTRDIYLTGSAKLGIGTNNPTLGKVQIEESINNSTGLGLVIRNTSTATNSYSSLKLYANNGAVEAQFFADGLGGFVGGDGGAVYRTYTNHPLIFGTNASERMRITKDGLIGIGTNSPTAKLHIKGQSSNYCSKFDSDGASNFNQFISTDGTGEYGIWNDALYFQALDSLSNGIRFFPNTSASDATSLRLTPAGNLLLGTTETIEKFTISKSTSGYGFAFALDKNGVANDYVGMYFRLKSANGSTLTYVGMRGFIESTSGSSINSGLSFTTAVDTSSSVKMVLTGAGNLGIGFGNTSPSGIIHAQDANFTNTSLFERTGQTSDAMFTGARILATKNTNMADGFGSAVSFCIRDDAGVINNIGLIGAVRAGADNTGDLVIRLLNAGAEAEKMRIKYDGKVGIGGITSPAFPLEVGDATEGAIGITNTSTGVGSSYLYLKSLYTGLANASKFLGAVGGQADASTGGRLVFFTSSTAGTFAERMRIDNIGNVGIGATPAGDRLTVSATYTVSGSRNNNSIDSSITANLASGESTYAFRGANFTATKTGAGNLTSGFGIRGLQNNAVNNGSGNITQVFAFGGIVQNTGTGTITDAYGSYIFSPTSGASSPITNAYGYYVASQKSTGITNAYGFYSAGASDLNYFAGKLGLAGATTPVNALCVGGNGIANHTATFTTISGNSFNAVSLLRTNNNQINVVVFVPNGTETSSNVEWSFGMLNDTNNFSINTYDGASAVARLNMTNAGDCAIGTNLTAPSARLHITKTTEQLRVGYDTSNYFNATVGSSGITTLDGAGASAKFVFNKAVETPQIRIGGVSNYATVDTGGRLKYFGTARKDWTKITANSITLTAGTSASTVSDLQTMTDGNFYTLTEANATPAMDLIVDFVSVSAFEKVRVLGAYNGSSTHAVAVQVYNWNTSTWNTFNAMQNDTADTTTAGGYILGNYEFTVYDDTNYIGTGGNAGKVRVRLYHTMSGNASHKLYLDEVSLRQ